MFANEKRRIRARLALLVEKAFSSVYVSSNGWGRSSDLFDTETAGLKFATLDRIQIGDGLPVIDSDTNKLSPDWEVGIFSNPADSAGNLNFTVSISFPAMFIKEIRTYWNTAYGPVLAGAVQLYHQNQLIHTNTLSTVVSLPQEIAADKLVFNVTKTEPYRRVNLLEVSVFSGFDADESRISEVRVIEDICGTELGRIVAKQVSAILRNEDELFSEAYIPQWGRSDAELFVKIYDEDEEITYNKLIPIEFRATKREAKIEATDLIQLLKTPLYATAPDNSSLANILNVLAQYYGVSFSYPSYFSTITVPVPVLGKTGYDTLRDIALATGCLCWCDRDGTIVLRDIGQGTAYTLTGKQVLSSSKDQSDDFLYNTVSVAFYTPTLEPTSTILSTQVSLNGEEEFEFDFKTPYKNVSVQVQNCTLVESKIGNYGCRLKLSGTGTGTVTIQGQKIQLAEATVAKKNEESVVIYGEKKLNVTSKLVQTKQVASNLADKILNTYAFRSLLMKAKTVHPYNFRLNDIISYGTFQGTITRLEIELHAGLRSNIEVIQNV